MPRIRPIAFLPPLLLGFLTLAVQTLLLRQFLWRVESTSIGVGVFLATWLAWIGIGALLAQTHFGDRAVDALAQRFPMALWLYLPLAALQFLLIEQLRALVGVPEYLASPIGHMALGALLVNAPVSFVTGLLFPAATRWLVARGGSTALTYALDTVGAVAAGLLVTALLATGMRLEGAHVRDWQRFFPGGRPEGEFTTPAATYLYGSQGGTFYTLSAGGVVDMLPEPERSAEVAALLLSQKPGAARVLLLGRAPLAVAGAVQEFQPGSQVSWCHDDPAYARQVQRRAATLAGHANVSMVVADVGPQAFLRKNLPQNERFDLVVIWPASPASFGGAAMLEPAFLRQVQGALKPDGIVALLLGGGPGAWSLEQRRLAAAVVANALAVWPEHGLLAPGAGCWWLTGNQCVELADQESAVKRFAQLHAPRFPAAAVAELYDPMRAEQLRELCRPPHGSGGVESPTLIARYGLAAALHAEWPAFPMARRVLWLEAHGGMALFLLLLGVLWLAPTACGARDKASVHLAVAGLAAGGFLGLAGLLALMQQMETNFGNLYLLAGLASSLYLAGMFAGNRMVRPWRRRPAALQSVLQPARLPRFWVLAAVAHGAILLGLLALSKALEASVFVLLACFVAGVPAGWYVPLAVAQLRAAGLQERLTGAAVIVGDAFGSALGGMAMSMFLLPWMGSWRACLMVAVFAVGVGSCALARVGGVRFAARVVLLLGLLAAAGLAVAPRVEAGLPELNRPPVVSAKSVTATNAPVVVATTNAPEVDEDIPPVGQPRQVDMDRLRAKQKAGELSTHKADWF